MEAVYESDDDYNEATTCIEQPGNKPTAGAWLPNSKVKGCNYLQSCKLSAGSKSPGNSAGLGGVGQLVNTAASGS